MTKIQKELALKEKYKNDRVMSHLLECDHNILCINHTLKYNGASDMTLEEIGLILGVTRERVRQIEASALRKLKTPKIGRSLRDYIYM